MLIFNLLMKGEVGSRFPKMKKIYSNNSLTSEFNDISSIPCHFVVLPEISVGFLNALYKVVTYPSVDCLGICDAKLLE